ncbi:MAG: hypothetical protein KAU90_08960 [Sulfurovaceae bacterium]|nr:hypothetical protein [Sulfurovaceae bacterium]
MKNLFTQNTILMVLSSIVFVGGYFFLRLAYNMTDKMPFTQEIVLVILGTIATVLITAMLLNKQTTVELQKEQNVKFLELKTQTYQNLIDTIEDIILLDNVTETQLNKLYFHTHRLAIFASPSVLKEYKNFLGIFNDKIAKDKNISTADAKVVSDALAKLTIYIRSDLIGELDIESEYSQKQINEQIMENVKYKV